MKFTAIKTASGLKPAYDEDYEDYSKIKNGELVTIEVKKQRNPQFHRKYFSLINCAYAYQNERRCEFLFNNSVEKFRKTVEITAGHCETIYSISLKSFVDIPKTISFSKMDELEFSEFYGKVKDVLFKSFLNHISQEEFERNLINY